MYTAMVKGPFREWDREDTFCALPLDPGGHNCNNNWFILFHSISLVFCRARKNSGINFGVKNVMLVIQASVISFEKPENCIELLEFSISFTRST